MHAARTQVCRKQSLSTLQKKVWQQGGRDFQPTMIKVDKPSRFADPVSENDILDKLDGMATNWSVNTWSDH